MHLLMKRARIVSAKLHVDGNQQLVGSQDIDKVDCQVGCQYFVESHYCNHSVDGCMYIEAKKCLLGYFTSHLETHQYLRCHFLAAR